MSQEQNLDVEVAAIVTRSPKAVAANLKPEGWELTLPDPYAGKTLEELIAAYGETVVVESSIAQMRVKFQSAVRTLAEQGKSDEEIAKYMESWKPGDKISAGVNPQTIAKNFANMSPEQRAELLALLQGQM